MSVHLSLAVWGPDWAVERFVRLMRNAARADGYGHHPDPTFSTVPFLEESEYLSWHRLATERPDPDDSERPSVDAGFAKSIRQALLRAGDYEFKRVLDAVPASHTDDAQRPSRESAWFLNGFTPPDSASREGRTIRYHWDDVRRGYGVFFRLGKQLERLDLHYVVRAADAYPLSRNDGSIAMEYLVQDSDCLPEIHVEASDAGAQFVRFLLATPGIDMNERLRAWAPTRFEVDIDLPDDLAADAEATFQAAGWELVEDWWAGEFDDRH